MIKTPLQIADVAEASRAPPPPSPEPEPTPSPSDYYAYFEWKMKMTPGRVASALRKEHADKSTLKAVGISWLFTSTVRQGWGNKIPVNVMIVMLRTKLPHTVAEILADERLYQVQDPRDSKDANDQWDTVVKSRILNYLDMLTSFLGSLLPMHAKGAIETSCIRRFLRAFPPVWAALWRHRERVVDSPETRAQDFTTNTCLYSLHISQLVRAYIELYEAADKSDGELPQDELRDLLLFLWMNGDRFSFLLSRLCLRLLLDIVQPDGGAGLRMEWPEMTRALSPAGYKSLFVRRICAELLNVTREGTVSQYLQFLLRLLRLALHNVHDIVETEGDLGCTLVRCISMAMQRQMCSPPEPKDDPDLFWKVAVSACACLRDLFSLGIVDKGPAAEIWMMELHPTPLLARLLLSAMETKYTIPQAALTATVTTVGIYRCFLKQIHQLYPEYEPDLTQQGWLDFFGTLRHTRSARSNSFTDYEEHLEGLWKDIGAEHGFYDWETPDSETSSPPKDSARGTLPPSLLDVPYDEYHGVFTPCGYSSCLCSRIPPSHKMKACRRCWSAFYCSNQCQERAWKDGHKTECTELRAKMSEEDRQALVDKYSKRAKDSTTNGLEVALVSGSDNTPIAKWVIPDDIGATEITIKIKKQSGEQNTVSMCFQTCNFS